MPSRIDIRRTIQSDESWRGSKLVSSVVVSMEVVLGGAKEQYAPCIKVPVMYAQPAVATCQPRTESHPRK